MDLFRTFFVGLVVYFSAFLAGSANTATIDFNEGSLSFGTVVTNQFVANGATFETSASASAEIFDIELDAAVPSPIATRNGPNGLRVFSNGFTESLTIKFNLTGALGVFGTVSKFSFDFISDVAGVGSLRAYDSSGNFLGGQTSVLGGSSGNLLQEYETLSVSAVGIFRVEIDGFADVVIDSINFEPTTSPVPLPAALPLLGGALGLMGIAGWRRRRHGIATS